MPDACMYLNALSHTPLQDDLERVRLSGKGRVDITVGSALDIFGGKLAYDTVVDWHQKQQRV